MCLEASKNQGLQMINNMSNVNHIALLNMSLFKIIVIKKKKVTEEGLRGRSLGRQARKNLQAARRRGCSTRYKVELN